MLKRLMKPGIVILMLSLFSCEDGGSLFSTADPVVGIQPFGSIDEEEIDSVQLAVERMYEFEVMVLDRVEMPEMAYTEIRYPRYRADSLVEWISNHRPDSVDMVLGLTNQDISITKYKKGTRVIKDPEWMYKDFGIFGLGRVGGTACVVSSNRLHKNVGKEKFYKRLKRISCHEVGHVLGLHHCPEKKCLMNDANESIKTIDNSTGELCSICWNEIH